MLTLYYIGGHFFMYKENDITSYQANRLIMKG